MTTRTTADAVVLHGGRVFTADRGRPWVDAVGFPYAPQGGGGSFARQC
jgi:hypothetical protein